MMKHFRKYHVWFMLLPMLCIALMAFKGDKRNFLISKNLDIFHAVFRELDMMYVDSIDASKVINDGIHAMLSKLDPYTVYYPEDEDEDLKMMMTGKYAGVGAVIRYHKRHDRVVIVEPYENMPALSAGLRAGDVLMSIDGEDLKGLPVDKVSEKLRGESGTTLVINFLREGVDSLMEVKVTRANIAMPAVPYYALLPDSTGYIILNSFTEKCARDVRLALVDLKNQGASRLVLDLRGNGGGSLAEAVDIAGLFLPKGTMVVYTRGKIAQSSQTFTTRREPLVPDMPLVVLVDGQSASASEIVAGAIQDLDRGVVMGQRTFGKGLVQTVRDLPYNSSLKLTTSKYYTPSGRCVQKIDYFDGKRVAAESRDTAAVSAKVFYTRSGRKVEASGGIAPDVEVEVEHLPNLLYYLANSDVLFDFATEYARQHPTIAPIEEFEVSDSLYAAFKEAVKVSDFTYDRGSEKALKALEEMAEFEGYKENAAAEFAALREKLTHNIDHDFEYFDKDIRSLLADELVTRYYYQRGSIVQALKSDSTLLKARQLLSDDLAYRAVLTVKD